MIRERTAGQVRRRAPPAPATDSPSRPRWLAGCGIRERTIVHGWQTWRNRQMLNSAHERRGWRACAVVWAVSFQIFRSAVGGIDESPGAERWLRKLRIAKLSVYVGSTCRAASMEASVVADGTTLECIPPRPKERRREVWPGGDGKVAGSQRPRSRGRDPLDARHQGGEERARDRDLPAQGARPWCTAGRSSCGTLHRCEPAGSSDTRWRSKLPRNARRSPAGSRGVTWSCTSN